MGLFQRFSGKPSSDVVPFLLSRALVAGTGEHAQARVVQAVVDFVNAAQAQAMLRADELPPHAMQVYEVDRYLTYVRAGGHADYEHRFGGHFDSILPLVEQGLLAMRAKPYLRIFRNFRLATRQCEGRDDALAHGQYHTRFAPLDAAFAALDQDRPLTEYAAKLVMKSDPVLLSDEDFQLAIAEMAAANPHLAKRQEAAKIATLRRWLCHHETAAAGILLGAAEPPDVLERLLPGQILPTQRAQIPTLVLDTGSGPAHVVFREEAYSLHRPASRADRAEAKLRGKPATTHDVNYAQFGLGKPQALVLPDIVDRICEGVAAHHVPLGLYLMLEDLGLSAPDQVGWLGTPEQMLEGQITWVLRIQDNYYSVVMSPAGLSLFARGVAVTLTQLSFAEVKKHAATVQD